MARTWAMLLAMALVGVSASAQQTPEPVQPPPHTAPWPMLGTGQTQGMIEASFALGPELQRGQSAREVLAERRKLDRALGLLLPQRKGVVDVYVVSVALDSDPVFS